MKHRKRPDRYTRAAVIAVMAVLLCGKLPVYASQDTFPEGMTEAEQEQLLDEMYGDIAEDEEFSPEEAVTPEDVPVYERKDILTDEEAAALIQGMLPEDVDLETFVQNYEEKILPLADYYQTYDVTRGMYQYIFPGGKSLSLSLPIGAWSNQAVVLAPEEGVILSGLLKDGERLTEEPGEDGAYFFRETGQYAFIAYEEDSDSRAYISGSFRIADVKQPVTDSFLWAPEGYSVGTVTVDGREISSIAVRDDRYLLLEEDGLYDITFFSRLAGRGIPQTYRVMLVRDTTPPIIQWEGDIQNGRFFGDVRFSVPEPDTEVSIWFNGQPAIAESHIIGAAGNYYIVASDPTGNERKYSFVLEQTLRIPKEIIIGGAGVLAVVTLVMIMTGKWIGRVR